ncbi:hypothetical protein [Nocardia sp. NPDC056000]|uniref:hypothetical protein n=1 Tax=Nocardia sp. NPDC056000 TaxID=3345674 RepID=UPI0035DD261A
MRIFRDSDDDHEPDDEQPGNPIDPDNLAAAAELLADEIAEFFTAIADHQHTQLAAHPLPAAPTTAPPAPTVTVPENSAPATATVAKPHTRSQIWRASAVGSGVVVAVAAIAAWDQPAEVGAPVVVYGLGWITYLLWNTARRPSPSLALAAYTERRAAARTHRAAP